MGKKKGGTSKKTTRSIEDKIKKCNQYLSDIQKQKTPSNAEINVLKNNIKELEKLQTAKKNDPKIYCIRPNSIVKTNKTPTNQPPPPPPPPSTNQKKSNSNSDLSPGAIAGIVIACIVVVLLISFGIYKLKQKK